MSIIKSGRFLFLVGAFWSCNNVADPIEKIGIDTISSMLPADTGFDRGIADTVNIPEVEPDTVRSVIRPGLHDFTLHWISWDRPGKVNIEAAKNGWYPVSGSQRDGKGNFITIDGELQAIDPLELRFRGVIHTKVETINNGDTCTRTGEKIFLSTKNRKYWRLQEMENCEGGRLVDYIDIYF